MIKITHTKTHELLSFAFIHIDKHKSKDNKIVTKNVLVTDAKLVLVEEKLLTVPSIQVDGKIVKPILISETEKIEVGDYILTSTGIEQILTDKLASHFNGLKQYNPKILALPEHFSPEQLQMIVDGKLNGWDMVLVECEEIDWDGDMVSGYRGENLVPVIKLNPHITIYVNKAFSLDDAKKFALEKFDIQDLKNKYPKGGSLSTEHIQAVLEVGVECGYKFGRKKNPVEEMMYNLQEISEKFIGEGKEGGYFDDYLDYILLNNPKPRPTFKEWFEENVK